MVELERTTFKVDTGSAKDRPDSKQRASFQRSGSMGKRTTIQLSDKGGGEGQKTTYRPRGADAQSSALWKAHHPKTAQKAGKRLAKRLQKAGKRLDSTSEKTKAANVGSSESLRPSRM